MLFFSHLRPEFLSRIDRGIDFPAQLLLRALEPEHDFGKSHFTDDQEVDIAARLFVFFGQGAVDESRGYPPRQRSERPAQNVSQTGGLSHKALELGIDERTRIRAVIDLAAANRPPDDPRLGQRLQFPLDGSLPRLDGAADMRGIDI